MKKFIIIMNFISLISLFMILSSINITIPSGITGFATAFSSATFDFHPAFLIAFLILLLTIILNTYFFFLRKYK